MGTFRLTVIEGDIDTLETFGALSFCLPGIGLAVTTGQIDIVGELDANAQDDQDCRRALLADHRQFQVSLGLLIMIVLEVGSEVEGHFVQAAGEVRERLVVLGDR